MPDLNGTVVTMDALHLHRETMTMIIEEKHGNFLIGLKGNRQILFDEAKEVFARPERVLTQLGNTIEKEHGRVTERNYEAIGFRGNRVDYPYIKSAIRVHRNTTYLKAGRETKQTSEVSYYITSLDLNALRDDKNSHLIRGHWTIESKLHHVKDRTMKEDRCRARAAVGCNLAIMRSLVVQVLQHTGSAKSLPCAQAKFKGDGQKAVDVIMSKNLEIK
jgi:predicted transposase YbfD/YdcC